MVSAAFPYQKQRRRVLGRKSQRPNRTLAEACSRFDDMMLCPILCPGVPKIVLLPYTAADRLMALGRIHESS